VKRTAVALGLALAACAPRPKLVEWGWDEPDPAFMRRHVAEMAATPFDGCVFHVGYLKPGGGRGSLSWEMWGRRALDETLFESAVADLRAARPLRFTERFLRVNVTPGDLDWFDDMGPVVANAQLAARIAWRGHVRGILLDVEQYQGQVFDYRRQRYAASQSFESYAIRARLQGREVMEAFQSGYPGLTLFLSFGPSLPFVETRHGRDSLADVSYGLLCPFVDGLLDGARGSTRIVDGYELSYGFTHPPHFDEARTLVKQDVLAVVGNRAAYEERVDLAFGLWMDYDWRHVGWSATAPEKNYFSPERWAASVARARALSDEYVWIYTEGVRWWGPEAASHPVPEAYRAALARRP
jgi:hypothetical protein